MSGYEKEREFFLTTFAREFPNASLDVARWLLRDATSEQRWNEIQASIELSPAEERRQERRAEFRAERVRLRVESIGGELIESGDPRGFPFLIRCPSGRSYDWGGRGLGIPGRGLPARCFS